MDKQFAWGADTAVTGDSGVSVVGDRGVATSGAAGVSIAGEFGMCAAGEGGLIIIYYKDKYLQRMRCNVAYVGKNALEPGVLYCLDEDTNFTKVVK